MERIANIEQFDDLVANRGLTVIKFYTDWCPDCHRVAAAYADYAREHEQGAAFGDVNAEEVREAAERYDVRGIPSFLVFRDGELVDRLYSRDAKTIKQMVAFLDGALRPRVQG